MSSIPYSDMTLQQRADYLLSHGVLAKLDIDPEKLEPAYSAYVIVDGEIIKLSPVGYHDSEQSAVQAGIEWLREKAGMTTRGVNSDENNEGDTVII
jgi:hypothetical protein